MKSLGILKLWVFRCLCHPFVGAALNALFRGRVRCRGFILDTRNNHISATNIAAIFLGLYERAEIQFTRQFLDRDLDVVELGSSLGIVALTILNIQKRERKLVCVEANPKLTEVIKRNLSLNFARKPVEVFNRAVDYGNRAEVVFEIDEGNLGSRINREARSGSERNVSVETTTLTQILSLCHIENFALVCDIEGAEVGILLEDTSALAKCRQMIVELHPVSHAECAYSVEDLRAIIEGTYGFRLVARRNDVFVFDKQ